MTVHTNWYQFFQMVSFRPEAEVGELHTFDATPIPRTTAFAPLSGSSDHANLNLAIC